MERMKMVWQYISNIGITTSLEDSKVVKIQLLNQILIFFLIACTIGFPVYYYMELPHVYTLNLLGTLAMIIGLILSHYQKHSFLPHYFIIITTLLLILGSYWSQSPIPYYIFVYPLITIAYFFFSNLKYQSYYLVFFIMSSIAIFIFSFDLNIPFYTTTPAQNVQIYFFFIGLFIQIASIGFFLRIVLKQKRTLGYSNSLLSAALESTIDGIMVANLRGELIKYNQKWVTLWKVPKAILEQGDNQTKVDIMFNQIRNKKEIIEKAKDLYRNPNKTSLETIFLKDGRIFDSYSQPQTLKGKIIGRVWSFRDVTEQRLNELKINLLLDEAKVYNKRLKQQTSEIKQANSELKRSNQELEQFAYVASHDLQEPLRMVGNFTQLLEEEYREKLDEEGELYINFIVDGVTRMSKLIENLLEYSRVGRKEMVVKNVNIEAIVEEKLKDLAQRIQDKKASVSIDNFPKVINCEANQIGIVFYNLISNALKFNKSPLPKIVVSGGERGQYWLFSVMDNGIGIDPKHQDRIFEIFKRLHRKEEYEGTGIGLSLCKRIILRHKGDIWFESELGKGTTFYFTIYKNLTNESSRHPH